MTYSFGDCVLDSNLQELRRDGKIVPVEPKAYDLLLYLIRNRNRLVSKDELNREVWNSRIVSDAALSYSIKIVRQAIGDDGRRQEWIRTAPRRGFRFVGDVDIVGDEASVDPSIALHNNSERIPATVRTNNTVAVLPFVNLSEDPKQEFMSDGITEDIITSLSKVAQLQVIARNSSFVYKNQAKKSEDIGKDLGARFLVEGSVRKDGNRVRITCQLVDSDAGIQKWADSYTCEYSDVFAVQDDVTEQIVSALAIELTPEVRSRIKAQTTDSIDAYDLFLQGRELMRLRTQQSVTRAYGLFEKAVELDLRFAKAHAFLAHCLIIAHLNRWQFQTKPALELAIEKAEEAIRLDAQDTDAHVALGNACLWSREHERAITELELALEIDPNSDTAHVMLGLVRHYAGLSENALEPLELGIRLNPHYPDIHLHWAAQIYAYLGQYEKAVSRLERRIDVKPDTDISRVLLAACLGHMGRFAEARETWSAALKANPEYSLAHKKSVLPFKHPGDFDRIFDGLRKAGIQSEDIETIDLSLPDKPSIAVLPFDNLSGDPDQECISDGIAEDVTNALSRYPYFFVIARGSSFVFKETSLDVPRIASELGVRYIVQGSVRRSGNRLRISSELIDAVAGNQLWADRFDGDFEQLFDLQDRITEQIVVTVDPTIQARERARARRKPPESLDAWELLQRGLWHFHRVNKEDRLESIRLFREAASLDPDFASANAHLAFALWTTAQFGYADDRPEAIAAAWEAAEKAITVDPTEPLARVALGRLHIFAGETDMAIREMQTAVDMNPNYSGAYYGLCHAYHYGSGKPKQAMPHYDAALRLSPRSPMRWVTLMTKGSALRALGRQDEAVAHCREACRFPNSGFLPYMHLAASLAEAGQCEEARTAVETAKLREPRFSISFIKNHFVGMHPTTLESLLDSLRKAAVPE